MAEGSVANPVRLVLSYATLCLAALSLTGCNETTSSIRAPVKAAASAPVRNPNASPRGASVALNLTGTLVDDPDAMLFENYACGGVGNYNGYCSPESDKLIEQQSMEADQEKGKRLVWEIERRLTEDDAKPLVYFNRGGICWDPKFKGLTVMVNSIYNGWRMEDIWLDR